MLGDGDLGDSLSFAFGTLAMIDSRRETERYASLNKLFLSEDFQEAARAFAEKRPAGPFKGR